MSNPIDARPLTTENAVRLDRLFRLYNARLLGFAATRTRDFATAEDVVSETWLRAAVSLSQLRADDAHAYGWLRSIAFRAAVDQYRPRSASEKPEDWTDALASRALPAVPAAEAVTDVFALDVLSVPQCAAVKLAAQGLSNTRIARQLGKSRQAVQQNLASSARRLRASVALAG